MSDESPRIINRGREAASILEAPLFREAMTSIDADLFAEWRMARTSQDRETIWYLTRAREFIEAWLTKVMQDGEIQHRHDAQTEEMSFLERAHRHFHPSNE